MRKHDLLWWFWELYFRVRLWAHTGVPANALSDAAREEASRLRLQAQKCRARAEHRPIGSNGRRKKNARADLMERRADALEREATAPTQAAGRFLTLPGQFARLGGIAALIALAFVAGAALGGGLTGGSAALGAMAVLWNPTARTVFAILGWFPASLYGARGDGATEDTSALQTCMNAAVAAGGTVLLAAGIYLTGPLNYKTDAQIRGEGKTTVMRLKPSQAFGMTTGQRKGLFQPLTGSTTTVTGVLIESLKLEGESAEQWEGDLIANVAAPLVHGIYGLGVQRCVFRNIWAEDFFGDGLYLGRGSVNASIAASHRNLVEDVVCTLNQRNGAMLSDGNWNTFRRLKCFENQQGMNPASPYYFTDQATSPWPSAEFDLEPNPPGQKCLHTVFEDCDFYNGWSKGFQCGGGDGVKHTRWVWCRFYDNREKNFQAIKGNDGVFSDNVGIYCYFGASSPAHVSRSHLHMKGHRIKWLYTHFEGATGGTGSDCAITITDEGSGDRPQDNGLIGCTIDIAPNGETGRGATVYIHSTADGTRWEDNDVLSGILDFRDTTRWKGAQDSFPMGFWVPGRSVHTTPLDFEVEHRRVYAVRFVPVQDEQIDHADYLVTKTGDAADNVEIAIFDGVPVSSEYQLLARTGSGSGRLSTLGKRTLNFQSSLVVRRGRPYYVFMQVDALDAANKAKLGGMSWGSTDRSGFVATTGPNAEALTRILSGFGLSINIGSMVVADKAPLIFLRSTRG
jgi:hypothetical protein